MPELPARPVNVRDLPTPALVVRETVFEANVARMSAARPGRSLRPHVKAFKSTALARRLARAGHDAFCCATPAEVVGMAKAGLDADLLLANECLDADRLRAMADLDAPVTVRRRLGRDGRCRGRCRRQSRARRRERRAPPLRLPAG